jgi:hypothetical protein
MNNLEKIAIAKLKEELYSAMDRCHEKNSERMQHERIFILGDVKRAIDIVNALEENSGVNR